MVPARLLRRRLATARWLSGAGLLLLLLLCGGRAARAEQPAVRLLYSRGEGASGCPDERTLRESVAARLGYDPFAEGAANAVAATLGRGPRGLRAVVELRDANGRVTGSRLLTTAGNDCQELASAMALAICIAVDPFVLSRHAEAPEPPPAPLVPPCPACPVCPPPPRSPVRFRVGAGAQLGVGAVPTVASLGVTVQAELRYRAFALGIEGRVDPRLGSASAPAGGGVSATLLLGIIAPCARWRVLGFCALLGLGALQGIGTDVTTTRQDTTFYAAAGARLAVEVPLRPWLALDLHLDGLTPLTYTSLSLTSGEVWSTPPLSGALGANLQALFP
jgi:hypothetical protein